MPQGPWQDETEARNALNDYAHDKSKGGGGFKLMKDSGTKPASSYKGRSMVLKCSCAGIRKSTATQRERASGKTGCEYSIHVEECSDGWIVHRVHNVHRGHKLTKNAQEAQAAGQKKVPDDALQLVQRLKHVLAPTKIFAALLTNARLQNQEVTFDYQTVYNLCRTPQAQVELDGTGFITYLRDRESSLQIADEPLHWEVNCDETGCIDSTFFMMRKGFETYAIGTEVVLYDMTHGTNRYGHKLGLFVTVHPRGFSAIIAASTVDSECEASITWVLQCFIKHFKKAPKVVLTDGCQKIARAVASAWPTTHHMLCIWHIAQNIITHLRAHFGSATNKLAKATWEQWIHQWWKVCQASDKGYQDRFDDAWKELASALEGRDVPQHEIAWFMNLGAKKAKFSYAYTCEHFTCGLHSTQRSESVHAAIKGTIKASHLMTDLVIGLDEYVDSVYDSKEVKELSATLKRNTTLERAGSALYFPIPAFEAVQHEVTSFAYDVMKAQASSRNWYTVNKDDNGEGSYRVTRIARQKSTKQESDAKEELKKRELWVHEEDTNIHHKTTLSTCTCGFQASWGLPCRHIIAVMTSTQQQARFHQDAIDPFWKAKGAEQELARRIAYTNSIGVQGHTVRNDDADESMPDKADLATTKAMDWVRTARRLDDATELDKIISQSVQGLERMRRACTKKAKEEKMRKEKKTKEDKVKKAKEEKGKEQGKRHHEGVDDWSDETPLSAVRDIMRTCTNNVHVHEFTWPTKKRSGKLKAARMKPAHEQGSKNKKRKSD